jgi:hypothetical protein
VGLAELLERLPGLERYRPGIGYLLLDELHCDEEALAGTAGLVQAPFRLERGRTPEAMAEVFAALVAWLQTPGNEGLQRTLAELARRALLPARVLGIEIPALDNPDDRSTQWHRLKGPGGLKAWLPRCNVITLAPPQPSQRPLHAGLGCDLGV